MINNVNLIKDLLNKIPHKEQKALEATLLMNILGQASLEQEEYSSAKFHFEKAYHHLSKLSKKNDSALPGLIGASLGLADIYDKYYDHEKSLAFTDSALNNALYLSENDVKYKILLAETYLRISKQKTLPPGIADKYLNNSLEIFSKIHETVPQYSRLAEVYSLIAHNIKNKYTPEGLDALKHAIKNLELKDNLSNESKIKLAELYCELGESSTTTTETDWLYGEALNLTIPLYNNEPRKYLLELSSSLFSYANALSNQYHYQGAEALMLKSISLVIQNKAPKSKILVDQTLKVFEKLSETYRSQQEYDSGIETLKFGLDFSEKNLDKEYHVRKNSSFLRAISKIYLLKGDKRKSLHYLENAFNLIYQKFNETPENTDILLHTIYEMIKIQQEEDIKSCIALGEQFLYLSEDLQHRLGYLDPLRLEIQNILGSLYYNQGAYHQALTIFKASLKSLKGAHSYLGGIDKNMLEMRFKIANIYAIHNEYNQAFPEIAYSFIASVLSGDSFQMFKLYNRMFTEFCLKFELNEFETKEIIRELVEDLRGESILSYSVI